MQNNPRMSVIIPTYNWSNALQLSLKSALEQTIRDIEILVIGDGCTDDSEKIVSELNDGRVFWFNFPENTGSQSAPNNFGMQKARAEWIAYLGHDDIWHSTHLELLLKTQTETNADYIFSGTILYGPPDTQVRAVAGFPYKNSPIRDYFAPPSTVMHRKNLIDKIGGWNTTHDTVHPIDYEFQLRAWDSGEKFASTGRISVFKFPAAWWRDSYKKRDVTRQFELIKKLKTDPHFFENELIEVAQSINAAMFQTSGALHPLKKGAYFVNNSLIRGVREPHRLDLEMRNKKLFTMDADCFAFEWYGIEKEIDELFRWTGPRTESTLDIPFKISSDIEIKIHVLFSVTEEIVQQLKIFLNYHLMNFKIEKHKRIGWWLILTIPHDIANQGAKNNLRMMFKVPHTVSPLELDPYHRDRRQLGIAVGQIEISSI